MPGLTIGKLAAGEGVGDETVRFSQRRGLLALPDRTGSGFREYTEDDRQRLAFIRRPGSSDSAWGRSPTWYEKLFGLPPSFFPHDTEAVWELAEQRAVYIVQRPEHAGHAMHTVIIEDLDTLVAQLARRGLEPTAREAYGNGVRKITYVDPDGNEIGFGGVPG